MTQNSIQVKRHIAPQLKWKAVTIEVISAMLIIVLLYTGISKLIDRISFHVNLEQSQIFHNHAHFVSYAAPILEILIAISLTITKARKMGLLASALLMAFFTGYVIHLMATNPNLPCSCGGAVAWLSWPQHLALNIFLTTISIAGYLLAKKHTRTI